MDIGFFTNFSQKNEENWLQQILCLKKTKKEKRRGFFIGASSAGCHTKS